MTNKKTMTTVLTLSLSSVILSLGWLTTNLVGQKTSIFTMPLYHFVLIIAVLGFLITFISLYELMDYKRYKNKELKEKEKNVKDIHQYHRLIDPPDIDN